MTAANANHPPDELSLGRLFRRFVNILTLLFSLFLVVRTTFVEPHGVPTGSMAPTIFGHHRECPCPRCGYSVVVGAPAEDPFPTAYCPNCGMSGFSVGSAAETISGDRLLVDRFVFRVRPPHRWEVAVFHPTDESRIPYVKRIVGLPSEAIALRGGEVYANGELLRKPPEIVREMKIPVADFDRVPQPMGWTPRWTVESIALSKLPAGPEKPPVESVDTFLSGAEIHLDATARTGPLGLSYRHRNLETRKDEILRDDLGYNGIRGAPQPVADFILECEIEVKSGTGTVSIRLTDGSDGVRFDLAVGTAGESRIVADGGAAPLKFVNRRLTVGPAVRCEFAFVDRRVWFTLNEDSAEPWLDLPVPRWTPTKSNERRGTARPLQIQADGVDVIVRHLKISRDVHYRDEGENGIATPYQLASNEYFALGDNSANSEDSRAWKKPGVPEGDFLGKPFFVHQPLRNARLMLNGREQRFQTIDWDRMRLLR